MTPALLTHIGETLYCPYGWQTALARDLGVSDRTVRRWAAGDYPIPDDVPDALRMLSGGRIREIREVVIQIAASLKTEETR